MPAKKYNHTGEWTAEDAEAYSRYLKGIRGPREVEANAKSCWYLRNKGRRKNAT